MSVIKLFHGSNHIVKEPKFELGRVNNDYGKGFYCTESEEMAKEWACKNNEDGFVNAYELKTNSLKILNLFDGKYNVLNWIALLLKNRLFTLQDEIAVDARDYIIKNFSIDLSDYDVVIGYRADDSYFSYAQSFISNTLSLSGLNKALYLGKLGSQTVLISKKAYEQIKFIDVKLIKKEMYYPKFISRDNIAREKYHKEIKKSKSYKDDLFIMDILREEIKNGDQRIQKIIYE